MAIEDDRWTMFEQKLDELRMQFVAGLPARSEELRALLVSDEPAPRDALRAAAHKLAGTAGSFGFAALSRSASELERAASGNDDDDATLRELAVALAGACDATRRPT